MENAIVEINNLTFTYVKKDALLLPNDAFGQHLASSKRFNNKVDEAVIMEEAAKYYANILWPLSPLVTKKIEEVQKLGIKISMIAPSHGVIWRSNSMKIVEAYLKWAKGEAENRVIIVYDTMWGSTEKMARAILEGVSSNGVEAKLQSTGFGPGRHHQGTARSQGHSSRLLNHKQRPTPHNGPPPGGLGGTKT